MTRATVPSEHVLLRTILPEDYPAFRTRYQAAQDPARVESLRNLARERGLDFYEISSVTGQGLDALRHAMAERILVGAAEPG